MVNSPKLTINGVEYSNYSKLNWKKMKNKLGYFEILLLSSEASDMTNLAYNKKVQIEEYNFGTSAFIEVFKGYIRSVTRETVSEVKITGFEPGIKLFDRSWNTRTQYTNIASDTIVTNIADGIMDVGTNSITNVITVNMELDNKLRSIAQVTNINDGEWWTDVDGLGNDRINVASARYSSTSAGTITIGTEAYISEDTINSEQIFNCITVLGRGDGINQVKSETYGFCYYLPTLTADMVQTDNEFYVSDASGMVDTLGIVYINNEKIRYANRTGLRCYNLGTWDGSAWNSRVALNGAQAHSSGMTVWYAGQSSGTEYTKTNPATDSSVDTYGIREYTHDDRRIVHDADDDPNETCGKISKILFDKFKTPVRTIRCNMATTDTYTYDIGETFTIVDSAVALNDDFKIEEMEYLFSFEDGEIFTIVTNNQYINFLTSMDELKKNMDTSGTYQQGATNLYQVNISENIDSSYPMNLRFYIPNEAVAINSVKLNFKMKNYRADSKSVTSAPKFSTVTAGWWSTGRGFFAGNPTYTSGFLRNPNKSRKYDVVYNLHYTTENVPKTINSSANIFGISDGIYSYPASYTYENWDQVKMIEELLFSEATMLSDITFGDGNACTSILPAANWIYPIYTIVKAPNILGTFDRVKISGTVHNGSNDTRNNVTFYVRRSLDKSSWTTIYTETYSFSGQEYYSFDIEETGDYRDYYYKISIDSNTNFNVNQTTYADNSYLILTVSTFLKSQDELDYGIYENTTEFTPPGEVTIQIGEDGGSLTTLGTYTSDQDDLELSETIDFDKGTWYNIEITPTAGSYGGRMRIEASSYIQIYIESE